MSVTKIAFDFDTKTSNFVSILTKNWTKNIQGVIFGMSDRATKIKYEVRFKVDKIPKFGNYFDYFWELFSSKFILIAVMSFY